MPNFKPNWTFTDSYDRNGWMFAKCLPKGIDIKIICSTTIDIRFDAKFCTHSRNMTKSHDRIGWMFAERYYGRKILFRLVISTIFFLLASATIIVCGLGGYLLLFFSYFAYMLRSLRNPYEHILCTCSAPLVLCNPVNIICIQ